MAVAESDITADKLAVIMELVEAIEAERPGAADQFIANARRRQQLLKMRPPIARGTDPQPR